MGFLKTVRKNTKTDKENISKTSRKKRGWRIFSLILGIFFICLVAFFSYIYATGSKIFDTNISNGSLAKAIKGEKLNGEDSGRINIVLLGRGGDNHPGGLLTDSLLVASIDVKNKKIALISVPRDLVVTIKNHGQEKINASFADGYNDYLATSCKKKNKNDCRDDALQAGSKSTQETLSNVLGIPIQYYVMIDFDGFKQLVDKIGGIDLTVDKAIYDPLYPDKTMTGYEPFSIKAGQQHLNGEVALKYSRSRETTSDFDRSRRQQQVLSAIKDKTVKAGILGNPKTILDLVTIIGNHVRMSFSPEEIKLLADLIKNVDQGNIITKVISNAPGGLLVSDSSTGTYYLRPKSGNYTEIQKMVKDIFTEPSTNSDPVKIEVLNASKTPGLATKAAAQIKDSNCEVVEIKNSTIRYQKTLIYDYTGGANKAAISYLKSKYNAEVVEKKKDSSNNADVSIFIGDDFSSKS